MSAPADLVSRHMWPTVFFARLWREHAAEAPGLIDFLYTLKQAQTRNIASDVAPSMKSAEGLYESDFDLFARDHAGLKRLKEFAVQTVQYAVLQVNGETGDPGRVAVEICDAWYHITNDGGFHDTHGHSGCSWCGIYYLQLGDSGKRTGTSAPNGANRFYSPLSSGGAYRDYGNKYMDFSTIDPPISDGMLLLFPSYLLHSGLPYRGAKDRIVISFNSRSLLRT